MYFFAACFWIVTVLNQLVASCSNDILRIESEWTKPKHIVETDGGVLNKCFAFTRTHKPQRCQKVTKQTGDAVPSRW